MNRLKWRIVDNLIDLAGGDHEPETFADGDTQAGGRAAESGGEAVEAEQETTAEGAD